MTLFENGVFTEISGHNEIIGSNVCAHIDTHTHTEDNLKIYSHHITRMMRLSAKEHQRLLANTNSKMRQKEFLSSAITESMATQPL